MSLWTRIVTAARRATGREVIRVEAGVSIPDLPLYAQYQRIGGPLTPEEVTRAMREADLGVMWPLVILANDARRKDCHLQAILGTREMAVPSLDWEVTVPEDARRRDKKVAEWVTDALTSATGGPTQDADLVGFRSLVAHLQGGAYHGYALAETVYERRGGKLLPKGWNPIGAYRVLFEQKSGRPHWYDPFGTSVAYPGIDLSAGFAPGKLVFHQPRINGDEPHREGLSRVLLWAALFRNWSIRDWIALGELAWKPWRQGVYKKGADKKDIDELRNILRQMSSTGVALVPETTELKVEWAKGNIQGATHKELAEFLAGEMSKATLGQTLTTESGSKGARSLGEVHDQVRHDILEFDAVSVAETLRRDLIAPLVRKNFGPDALVPSFRFLTEESVDLVKFGQGVRNLKDAGLRIPASWVRQRAGIPEPKAEEECLGDGEIDIPIDPKTGLPAEPADPAGADSTPPEEDTPPGEEPPPDAAPKDLAMTLPLDTSQRRLFAEGMHARAIDAASRSVDYVCSTPAVDSHDTVIEPVWLLDRYQKNPVVLFAHDRCSIPIGRASLVRVENGNLLARVTFATEEVNEEAEECWRAVQAGLLNGISVGFIPHSYRWEMREGRELLVFSDNELLELSLCAVPSNPEALAQRSITASSIARLRKEREAQNVTPKEAKRNMDHEKEIEALRASVSQRDTHIGEMRAAAVAKDAEVASLAQAKAEAERAVAEGEKREALLKAEAERLGAEAVKLAERAQAAEDLLTRNEIEQRMGKDVEPHEVDHFVALKRSAPALYDAEMKRRAASGRDDAMTRAALPAGNPGERSADPTPSPSDIEAALARHLPKA